MKSQLSKLVCGNPRGGSAIANCLQHLSDTLDLIVYELPKPHGSRDDVHQLFTPFLARSILEITCTALTARIDPFRILAIAGAQTHTSYEPGTPNAFAFRWQGDVLAESKSELWNTKTKPESIPRALLGDYQDHVLWRPAFKRFLDAANHSAKPGEWTSHWLKVGLDGFVNDARKIAGRTFSRASKGIHHEFVVPISSYYDEASLLDLVEDSMKLAASLAIVASYSEHLPFRIPETDALCLFETLQP